MPTLDDMLAELNAGVETPDSGSSLEDMLSELNGGSEYQPPRPISYEQEYRAERLQVIRERAASGADPAENLRAAPQRRPGQQLTIGGVPAEQTNLPQLTMPERMVFEGMAGLGAAMSNPILRLVGRGDIADQQTRALQALNSYGTELAKDSVLGETIGPMIHNVGASLAEGTLASAAAPVRGGTASLALISTAFGVNGYDRAYVEAKDMGLPEAEAGKAGARQLLIDGAVTFLGGKAVQAFGLNPGRYLGPVIGRAAQRAAERSGFAQVLGSGAADATVNGLQGGLTYLNEVYTGVHDFKLDEFGSALGMSAAVGGVAGGVAAGVSQPAQRASALQEAFPKFQAEMKKAVDGAIAANQFAAKATPEQIQKALAAESAKDFAEATGVNKGPAHREAFQEELDALVELQAEAERRGIEAKGTLEDQQKALMQRRVAVEERALEVEGVPQEAEQARTPARRAEVEQIKEQIQREREAIAEEQASLDELSKSVEGEAAEYRAILEAELDRLSAAEREAAETPGSQPAERGPEPIALGPPVRSRTPKPLAQQYGEIETAITTAGEIVNRSYKGQTLDAATRKDLGKLIDTHVEGQANRVSMFNALANAKTPGQVRGVAQRLAKHLHNSELRVAKQDFEDAQKKAKNLRPEFAENVTLAREGVIKDNTDSLRDAAEAIREAAYQSAMADSFLTMNVAQGIEETAGQVVSEMEPVRPLAMKADDPIRKLAGQDTPGLEISRQFLSLDSPLLREMSMRPETQLARLSETLRTQVWERLGVQAQAEFDASTKETVQGLSDLLTSLGLEHPSTFAADNKLEAWRTEQRTIEGVKLSRDEAMGLFLLGMDPENAKVLEERGFVFPEGRKLPAVDERVNNQLLDFIGDEGAQVVDWMFRYLNGPLIDRVNDAKRLVTGRPLTDKRDRVPRVVDKTWDIVGDDPLKALTATTLQSYRHLKHREQTADPLTWPEGTTGGIDYFLNHSERMNRVAAYLAPARDTQALLNHPDVERAILAKDGTTGLENIREAVRTQVQGFKGQRARTASSLMARANGLLAAAKLGFRATTVMMQPLGAVAAAAYKPKGLRRFLQVLPDAVASKDLQDRMTATLGEHSGLYWKRFVGGDYVSQQTGGVYRGRGWFRPPTLAHHGMRPIQEAERVTSAAMHFANAELAAQDAGLAPTMPEWGPFVAREWERNVYRSDNTSNGMEASGIIREGRENPWLGMWAQFQSTASKVFSLLPRAGDLADQGRYQEAAGVLGAFLAAEIPVALLREAMTFEESEDPFLKAAGKQAIQDAASLHPLGNVALVPFVRSLQDVRTYDPIPAVPGEAFDLAVAAGDFAGGIMGQAEESDDPKGFVEKLWSVAKPLAAIGGLPFESLEDMKKRAAAGTVWPGLKREESQPSWNDTVDLLTVGEYQ